MSTVTPYYGLTKPVYADFEDVSVLDNNYDLIDAALHADDLDLTDLGARFTALEALNHYGIFQQTGTTNSVGNGGWAAMGFSLAQQLADPDQMLSDAGNPSQFTVKATGNYQVNMKATFAYTAANPTGHRDIRLRRVADNAVLMFESQNTKVPSNNPFSLSQIIALTLNDQFVFEVQQNSTGFVNVDNVRLSLFKVSN